MTNQSENLAQTFNRRFRISPQQQSQLGSSQSQGTTGLPAINYDTFVRVFSNCLSNLYGHTTIQTIAYDDLRELAEKCFYGGNIADSTWEDLSTQTSQGLREAV